MLIVNRPVIVPNAFTPNGDGLNDSFRAINLEDYAGAVFKIFNRFGQLIFQANQPPYVWDGKYNGVPQQIGNYVYLVDMPYCPSQITTPQGNFILIH